jgi:hypothetical protein
MTFQVGDAHAYVQRLGSDVKIVTVPEEYNTEEQRFVVPFCEHKDSKKRIFIKKYFLFAVGGVCRVKHFITGSRISLKDVRMSHMMKWRFVIS